MSSTVGRGLPPLRHVLSTVCVAPVPFYSVFVTIWLWELMHGEEEEEEMESSLRWTENLLELLGPPLYGILSLLAMVLLCRLVFLARKRLGLPSRIRWLTRDTRRQSWLADVLSQNRKKLSAQVLLSLLLSPLLALVLSFAVWDPLFVVEDHPLLSLVLFFVYLFVALGTFCLPSFSSTGPWWPRSKSARGKEEPSSTLVHEVPNMSILEEEDEYDPELVRGVPLRFCLHGLGKYWSMTRKADFDLSEKTDHIDHFLSHDWGTSRSLKVMTLLIVFNSCAAAVATSLVVLLLSITASTGLIPPKLWPWLPLPGFLCYAYAGAPPLPRQEQGIRGLGSFLRCSRNLNILWSERYFSRLWCCYEVAAYLKEGGFRDGEKSIVLIPVQMASLLLISTIQSCSTFLVQYVSWLFQAKWMQNRFFLELIGKGTIFVPLALYVALSAMVSLFELPRHLDEDDEEGFQQRPFAQFTETAMDLLVPPLYGAVSLLLMVQSCRLVDAFCPLQLTPLRRALLSVFLSPVIWGALSYGLWEPLVADLLEGIEGEQILKLMIYFTYWAITLAFFCLPTFEIFEQKASGSASVAMLTDALKLAGQKTRATRALRVDSQHVAVSLHDSFEDH
eukprot:g19072.t1